MDKSFVRPLNVFDMDEAMAEEVARRPMHPALVREPQIIDYAPPKVRRALPDYVEHRPEVGEIGQLSAEAVIAECEAAAKQVEAMGEELKARLARIDVMKADAMAVLEEIKETAAAHREEGKRVFLQIEDCTNLMAEVRATCQMLKGKIAISAVTQSS
jgi:hypothetical protein